MNKRGQGTSRNAVNHKMKVHYNNNGKLACVVRPVLPSHTTDQKKVTCRHCRAWIQENK